MGDVVLEVSPVGDTVAVELGLALVEPAAHGLARHGTAPLVVGAVALWRVALAAAARVPARGVAVHDAALADEPDGGELGRQGPVGVLIVLELAGHDTLDSSSSGPTTRYRSALILTDMGFNVKQEDDNGRDDHTRAVHVAHTEPGLPADRQLLPDPHRYRRPPTDLPAPRGRAVAADPGSGGRAGGAQPRGGTPPALRAR